MFKNAVFGPIMNEIQFTNPLHAIWLENTITNHLLLSFVVQSSEDYNLLLENLNKEHIKANVVMVDVATCDQIEYRK